LLIVVSGVFRDHEGIDPGANFLEIIKKKLAESKCILIIIGPNWLIELKKRAKGKDKDFVKKITEKNPK
jgi:hypothetical protein